MKVRNGVLVFGDGDNIVMKGRLSMPIKEYNPTSPGRRGMTAVTNDGLAPNKPQKSLTKDIFPIWWEK